MRVHHVVLLMLFLPILGVGILIWFLLPGSIAGYTYTPSQFNKQVQLRPTYWTSHDVTIRGYVRSYDCSPGGCVKLVMADAPQPVTNKGTAVDTLNEVVLLPQHEASWYAFLHAALPRFLAAPLVKGNNTKKVTITGRLTSDFSPGQAPTIRPNDL
ncbi:MAG: hypothetical protein JWO42_2361 [Chloroflexi bacterium]|nr:hypothetical protein [Chloroflexota bacterium]